MPEFIFSRTSFLFQTGCKNDGGTAAVADVEVISHTGTRVALFPARSCKVRRKLYAATPESMFLRLYDWSSVNFGICCLFLSVSF